MQHVYYSESLYDKNYPHTDKIFLCYLVKKNIYMTVRRGALPLTDAGKRVVNTDLIFLEHTGKPAYRDIPHLIGIARCLPITPPLVTYNIRDALPYIDPAYYARGDIQLMLETQHGYPRNSPAGTPVQRNPAKSIEPKMVPLKKGFDYYILTPASVEKYEYDGKNFINGQHKIPKSTVVSDVAALKCIVMPDSMAKNISNVMDNYINFLKTNEKLGYTVEYYQEILNKLHASDPYAYTVFSNWYLKDTKKNAIDWLSVYRGMEELMGYVDTGARLILTSQTGNGINPFSLEPYAPAPLNTTYLRFFTQLRQLDASMQNYCGESIKSLLDQAKQGTLAKRFDFLVQLLNSMVVIHLNAIPEQAQRDQWLNLLYPQGSKIPDIDYFLDPDNLSQVLDQWSIYSIFYKLKIDSDGFTPDEVYRVVSLV